MVVYGFQWILSSLALRHIERVEGAGKNLALLCGMSFFDGWPERTAELTPQSHRSQAQNALFLPAGNAQ